MSVFVEVLRLACEKLFHVTSKIVKTVFNSCNGYTWLYNAFHCKFHFH